MDKPELKKEYKEFWNKYKEIEKIKENNFIEYIKRKEILFLKYDIKKLRKSKKDYSKVIEIYKEKLIEYDAIRNLKNQCKTLEGKFLKATT